MSEATRLKMTGGHFIWIWADTSSTAEFFQPYDITRSSFDDEDYRRQKIDPKYYQNPNSRKLQQNQTRYKSINSSRYHHIVGLRNPSDEVSSKRDKRKKAKVSDDSVESDKINIKNINSHEFNANYYDPYVRQEQSQQPEPNILSSSSDFDDYDYAVKVNPYNLDLDNYSEMSNDSKAKRADNFFNISSHVYFHHFKDFPVGLLALRHIKMNVDRTFVRSAIRLFASTWARVVKNEEIRLFISGGKSASREFDENYRNKARNNNKVNSRSNLSTNLRIKRGAQEKGNDTTESSILTFVNSSLSLNNSESGLKQQQQTIKSNISGTDEIKSNISSLEKIFVQSDMKNVTQKRSWWSPSSNQPTQRRVQEKSRGSGMPQYKGGCFGTPSKNDVKRAEIFSR